MDLKLVLIIIAFVAALLAGLPLCAAMSDRRGRLLSIFGAIIFAAGTATGVFAYATTISVDALSYALGAFGAITIGAIVGTLVVNFLFSLRERHPSGLPSEL